MNVPRFSAESSLRPNIGTYRGKAVLGTSKTGQVLPMAPCCKIEDRKALQVTYAYTKCGPLRDFMVAPIEDMVVFDPGRTVRQSVAKRIEIPRDIANKLNRFGKTSLDQEICVTSQEPWNATLTETRACSGYTPVQSLVIDAFGDQVKFEWQGAVEQHPPSIGLVSCRHIGTYMSQCPDSPSTCECPSAPCPSTDPCECGLEGIW